MTPEQIALVADARNCSAKPDTMLQLWRSKLTRCADLIEDQAAELATLRAERDDFRDTLSGLALYLSVGSGDDTTTAEQYDKRIMWGIDHLLNAQLTRAADVVENCSKRPATTWGEVKAAILAMRIDHDVKGGA